MTTTLHLDLPLIAPAQAQKHVTHNEALALVDALMHLSVIDDWRSEPPQTPQEGDRHIIAAGASGAWAGHDGEIAHRIDGGWTFCTPVAGMLAFLVSANLLVLHDGTHFRAPLQRSDLVGIGTDAAADRRLSVASDSTLLTAENADHRLTINKTGEDATASLVFQSGFSARAEFGLSGSDDFAVKVSPDGSVWHDAIIVDRQTGFLGIGTHAPTTDLHVDGLVRLAPRSKLALPAAALAGNGALAFVTDGPNGDEPVYSDGASWRSVRSGTVI